MATIGEYLLELHYWLYDTPIPLRVKITIEKAHDVVCKYGFCNSTPNDKLDFLGDLSKWLINNDMDNDDAIHVLMAKHLILKYVLGD